MTNIHRTGNVDPIQIEVALTGAVPTNNINPGDFVAASVISNKTYAVPVTAAAFWNTDLATTQAAVVALLLGMASGRSRAATTDDRDLKVLVDMDGDIEFDCASAQYNVGQYVGFSKDTGNNLKQSVESVPTKARAVAVVVENTAAAATRLRARMINTPPKR